MKVALVVGHSAHSPGVQTESMSEFDFNDNLVRDCVGVLSSHAGIGIVVIHRSTYRALPDSINATGADMALCFHANGFDGTASGTEMLYYHSSTQAKALAQSLQNAVVGALGLPDRGVRPKHSEDRGGYVLRYTSMPCVILEPFFMDNPMDEAVVLAHYWDMVHAICDVIVREYKASFVV